MITVRPAATADLDAVVALEARAFGDHAWSPRSLESEFDQVGETRSIAVAVEAGEVVGYAVLMYAGGLADLPRIAVAHSHRRKGVARSLVAALVERASQLGCTALMLEVAASNRPAIALYEAQDFEAIDVRRGYYADGSDAIVMRRDV